MAAYEPDLSPAGRSNYPSSEQTFKVTLVFGSSVLASYKSKHLTVVRNTNGKYTITLPRTYASRTGFRWGWGKLAAGAVYFPVILTSSQATASSTGGGTFVVETRTESGTATDPASGDELHLEFDVCNDALLDDYTTTV